MKNSSVTLQQKGEQTAQSQQQEEEKRKKSLRVQEPSMEIDAEADKMAALKRAYAEIILNTAKESAARILASERKALRFQRSLFDAKEEALATMLRLKSAMDSKIKEEKMTTLSQLRRIQELEGQLNEAEHTIISLREELELVNKESKKMKNELVEPSNECKVSGQVISDNGKCHESQLSSDLASILTSGKDPELYRNGCTQRIHALEHNSLTVEVPNEQSDYQLLDSSNDSNISDNEKFEKSNIANSSKTLKVEGKQAENPFTSEVHVYPSQSSGNGHAAKFCLRSKKPRSKGIQVKSAVCATSHNGNAKNHEPSDIGNSKSTIDEPPYKFLKSYSASIEPSDIGSSKSTIGEPPYKFLKSYSASISSTNFCKDAEDRCELNIISSKEIPGLLQCNSRTVTEQIDVKKNNEDRNSIEGLTLLNLSRKKMKDDILLTGAKRDNEVKILQVNDSKLTLAENVAEISHISDMKETLSAFHTNSKVETNGKFLKYTFQRTRKRGYSSSKAENISPEDINRVQKSEEKQNVLLEPQKSTLATELPRNNRRLMQVARQLISLSEKRW